eukprot:6632349-Alexandrium_andersonii.AAC.1
MSASLVGSEMCIRDRAQADLPDSIGNAASRRVRLVDDQGQAAGRAAPVSYTHLTLPTICSV